MSFPMEKYMMVSHGMSSYLLYNYQPYRFNKSKCVDPNKNYSDGKKLKLIDK
nr:hypothetical protein [Megavirus caiporensis]